MLHYPQTVERSTSKDASKSVSVSRKGLGFITNIQVQRVIQQ